MGLAIPRLEDLRDPLLERDYVRLCARPIYFRNRTLAVVVLGIVLLLLYGAQDSVQSLDEMGRTLHLVFTWAAALYTGCMACAESAVAVPTERAKGSLTVLLTVPRSPHRLAAGFLLSRILVALTALLAILPLEGVALLLGGISGEHLLRALLCILGAAVYGAALGLLGGYSAVNHRFAVSRGALLAFSLWILLPLACWLGGVALHDFETPGASAGPAEMLFYEAGAAALALSPPGALLLHSADVSRGVPPLPVLNTWFLARADVLVAGLAAAWALLAVLVTGNRLREDHESAAVESRRRGFRDLVHAFLGSRERLPAPARTGVAKGVGRRALLWKEARPPWNRWSRWTLRTTPWIYAAGLAWLFLSPTVNGPGRVGDDTAFFDAFCSLPLWFLALGVAAGCGTFLAEEREKGSLDLLRVAPFAAREYFVARFLGIGARVLPFALATAPFVALGTFTGQVRPVGILSWMAGAGLVVPFLGLASFRAGIAAPTVRAAQRRIGGLLAIFVIGWPLVACTVGGLLRRVPDAVGEAFAALNPLLALACPYALIFQIQDGAGWRDLRFPLLGCVGAVFWALVALLLWWRIPPAFDAAMERAEAG